MIELFVVALTLTLWSVAAVLRSWGGPIVGATAAGARAGREGGRVMIEFLAANWLWIVLIVGFIALHRSGMGCGMGHGGHAGHGDHDTDRDDTDTRQPSPGRHRGIGQGDSRRDATPRDGARRDR